MQWKVMSFNTQHCMNFRTRKIDFNCMAKIIQKCSADIVGLNEMRMAGEHPEYTDQVPRLAERAGYPYWYFAKAIALQGKNPYGNGLLSRYPILSAETIPIPDPAEKKCSGYYETRCLLHAKIDVPGGLDVFVTHFGLNLDEQENAVRTILESLTASRCVLMGDFNITPENPVLQPIKDCLFDTAQLFEKELLSFPSNNPEKKIDYIFTSRDMKVLSADIPQIVASDHCPHTASIEL